MTEPRLRLGLVVNPYAGLGGPRALKGSDVADLPRLAQAQGWPLTALERARTFLKAAPAAARNRVQWYAPIGLMGGASLTELGIGFEPVSGGQPQRNGITDAKHTREVVDNLIGARVDFLFFVGGDGTARDVLGGLPPEQPALGVPAGVKMQSGVFAISPYHAAQILESLAGGELVRVCGAEVRDIDETLLRNGRIASRFFGEMTTLQAPAFVAHTKQAGMEREELVLLDIADYLKTRIPEDALIAFGPGSTTFGILRNWGLEGTLLGVDLIKNQRILARDVDAQTLEQNVRDARGKTYVVVTFIGGQGHIFGRGNQQFTPTVLRHVGRERVVVVSSKSKLRDLQGRPLLIDSGDQDLDRQWVGFTEVVCGFEDNVIYPVA